MRGFAQPTTYVVIIMKNFLTAIASALLVAVIVTSLHYFVFSNDLDRAPMALFILSFLGMAAVALFNVRLSALRSGIGAATAAGTAAAVAGNAGRARGNSKQARGGGKNAGAGNRGGNGARKGNARGAKDARSGEGGGKTRPAGNESKPAAAAASAPIPDGPRENGSVKWFNRSKGFGFIIRPNGEEIFVHHRSIRNSDEARRSNLRDGQDVNYVVADHAKGQQAEDVVGE